MPKKTADFAQENICMPTGAIIDAICTMLDTSLAKNTLIAYNTDRYLLEET